MLEKQIETAIKDYARSKGWLAYKWTSPGHAFVPDGLFISPKGQVICMEFKQLGKKATPGQQREINRINAHGILALVIDRVGDGKGVIDAYS